MKNFILILAIILLLLPSSIKNVVVDLASEELEAYGVAGAIAMVPTSLKEDQVKEKCLCDKNTGKISYDGGTSVTDCPCRNGECGCKKSVGAEEDAEKLPRIILVTQVRVCPPCRKTDTDIVKVLENAAHQKSGWKVGKESTNNLQVLDLDDPDSIKEIERLGLEFSKIPSFFKVTNDEVFNGPVGSISYDKFIEFSSAKKK